MPRRVYAPAAGLETWKAMLADTETQWVRGASAFETAVFWEKGARTPRGLHPRLAELVDQDPAWRSSSVIAAFPEHRVSLPGGSRASQNDAWVMLRGASGLLSLAVEGKAGESFAETVGEWMKKPTDGRVERLEFLRELLGIEAPVNGALRYQLLHRAASAVIEATRIGAVSSGIVVASFKSDQRSKDDFAAFAKALGARFVDGALIWATTVKTCPLFLAWLDLPAATDADIAAATA